MTSYRRIWTIGSLAILAGLAAAPAVADVWVAGNGETLDVVVYGNAGDSADQMANGAFAIRQTGWHHLWQGDPGQKGWISVSCVRRPDGGVHFEFATEQPNQPTALDLARRAALQHVERYGGTLIEGCGGSVNNDGGVLAVRMAKAAP